LPVNLRKLIPIEILSEMTIIGKNTRRERYTQYIEAVSKYPAVQSESFFVLFFTTDPFQTND